MQYSAEPMAAQSSARILAEREARRGAVLRRLAASVKSKRAEAGLTLRALAARAGVSERFLVQLESGEGNISVARLYDVADALGTSPAQLLSFTTTAARPPSRKKVLALLGVRGAGKTAVGQLVAKRLKVAHVELDGLVAREAGMSLPTLFEIHGEGYFRRLERQALRHVLDAGHAAVIATGGSLVTDPETFALLRKRAITVWLKAAAEDHWRRVVAQGDLRPMKDRSNAMNELRALLRKRTPLYAQADHVVETSGMDVEEAARHVLAVATGVREP